MLAQRKDPLERPSRDIGPTRRSDQITAPPCRVIVVDDDEWMRVYLKSILESANYSVDAVDSGREAMRLLRRGTYEILLTDVQMPDVDGLTLCGLVRLEFAQRLPYVLMFTVMDTRADRYAGFQAGADDYIVKGAPVSELLAKMNVGRRVQATQPAAAESRAARREPLFLDPLTDAHNFKYFAKQMPTGIRRAQRSQRALAVLSCRIEGLENLTQQSAHTAADCALRAFATDVSDCLRKGSYWFARVGEERFVVVLPCTRFKIAERLARKLSRQFASVPVATAGGTVRCTVSIDVTACEPQGSEDRLPWEAIESAARTLPSHPSASPLVQGAEVPASAIRGGILGVQVRD